MDLGGHPGRATEWTVQFPLHHLSIPTPSNGPTASRRRLHETGGSVEFTREGRIRWTIGQLVDPHATTELPLDSGPDGLIGINDDYDIASSCSILATNTIAGNTA